MGNGTMEMKYTTLVGSRFSNILVWEDVGLSKEIINVLNFTDY